MNNDPVRICMLADTHGLYDDRIYWKEAVSLSSNGYEVHYILASDIDEKGKTKEGILFIKVRRKIYFRNRYLNYLIKRILPGDLYSRMFREAVGLKASVYHIHDLKVNRIGKKLKKLRWKPKVIYDVHEPHPENILDYNNTSGIFTVMKKWYANTIRKWEEKCARNYDLIITTEENMNARFRKFLPENKVQIIYNYTDLKASGKKFSFEQKTYDAIYCGGITELRGAMQILYAVRLAKKEKAGLQVLFLGTVFPPELKTQMEEFIETHQLKNNVVLHEAVPYKEVAGFYKRSRLGLGIFLPIPTHKIILQIKIFEYMNFGLPIIGSNFGHISRYIEENNCGLIVDPESPAEIAYAMISLLKNKNRYTELSENGIKASEQYRWPIMEQKLLYLYNELNPTENKNNG